jgi:hypothetical protein
MPDAFQPSFPMPADINIPSTASLMSTVSSPHVGSLMLSDYDFASQVGNAQIADLKNVMFPSDDPFAYPNQPISTLESSNSQFGLAESNSDAYATSNDASIMGTPVSMSAHISGVNGAHHSHPFEATSLQRIYEENTQMGHHLQAQSRHSSAPMTRYGGQMNQLGGQNAMYEVSGQMSQEDYWNHMEKGNVGTRTGFTPGAAMNLDELFGGDGWGGIWEQSVLPRS